MTRRASLIGSAALGLILGATVFRTGTAHAFGLDFSGLIAAVEAVGTDVVNMQQGLTTKLQSVQTYINQQLGSGFTQISNYQKAQVGAQEQIADANNQINAIQQRQYLDARIMAQHVVTPQACDALTNGQSAVAAALQTTAIANAIETVTDARGEAAPQNPSYAGVAQGIQAINGLHDARYCSATDAAAGICTLSATPDADQTASSLIGSESLADTAAVNTANDYATTLIEPVAPAAIRGNQLDSIDGQDAIVWRRHYNAQMSLARRVVSDVIASRTPSVDLTTTQQQEMQAEGLPVTTTASWLEALGLDVNRRESNVSWQAGLQAMPPKSVLIEIATELAEGNYIAFQNFKLNQRNAVLRASLLADKAQDQLPASSSVPIPNVASQ